MQSLNFGITLQILYIFIYDFLDCYKVFYKLNKTFTGGNSAAAQTVAELQGQDFFLF